MKIVITKLYQILLLSICLVETTINNDCLQLAKIPCENEFKSSTYIKEWTILYTAYLAKNASVDPESPEWKDLKREVFISNPFCNMTPLGKDPKLIQNLQICLDQTTAEDPLYIPHCKTNISDAYNALTVNYLEHMQTYLTSSDFAKSMKTNSGNDRQSLQIHNNYTKIHLTPTLQKFSKTCKISVNNQKIPSTHFDGDITDLGIIVNIINNSTQQFQIYQTTFPNEPIAHIQQGLNDVNLYTTVLTQEKKSKKTMFSFFESNVKNSHSTKKGPVFSIGIYTGQELVAFLKTLPRKNAKIFTMNGCPTSEQYLANPQDSYLVLSMPTRIQAINLSVFTGPYLLTMHINQDEDNTLQPFIVTAQTILQKNVIKTKENPDEYIKTEKLNKNLLPLLILPQFLWDIPMMQVFWMLHTSSYIAALTDFSCFGLDKFGSTFDYFNDLGYFDMNHKYRFVIDRYNILKPGETFFDANLLMGCALYESDLKNCADIPQVHPTQNNSNEFVLNNNDAFFINFEVIFPSQKTTLINQDLFNTKGFNNTYNISDHNPLSLIFSLSKKAMLESVFVKILNQKQGLNKLIWTDKENKFLNAQSIFLNFPITKMEIRFLTTHSNWKGIILPQNLASLKNQNLKITYLKEKNTFQFLAKQATPIDKINWIHTLFFSQYPITELYYELFNTFNIAPSTRCFIFQNGNLPKFLQNLTEEDWQNGIYLIPSIHNNQQINSSNKGSLTATFYKSDQTTILGQITTLGINSNNSPGILEPVKTYNLYSNQFKPLLEISLPVGILLKYHPNKNG